MNQLDQIEMIRKIDQHKMLDFIHNFSDQVKDAEALGQQLTLDPSLGRGVTKLVFSGLGGSAIGADFIRSYLSYEISVPILVNRHYRLPNFVDDKTLLVVSSYSGNTEETLSAFAEGVKRKAKILVISSGGELAQLARTHQIPLVQIPTSYPPRAALGYLVIVLLIALSKIGFPRAYRAEEVREAVELIRSLRDTQYGVGQGVGQNLAKQFAMSCVNRYVIIYSGSDYFDVVALRWRGQIEENAKSIASHHILPEMNHNELVGWKFPQKLLRECVVFLLRDEADHDRVRKRMDLTRKIVEPLAAGFFEVRSQGKGLLARMLSLVYLGDWVSFYLAVLNRIDPTPVEVIQYLKSELAKDPIA